MYTAFPCIVLSGHCVNISLSLCTSTVGLSDTPTVSGQPTQHGGVSQQHPVASTDFVTAEQVPNLPERGPSAQLQYFWWNDKGERFLLLLCLSFTQMNEWKGGKNPSLSFNRLSFFLASTVSRGWLCWYEKGRPPERFSWGPPQDARRGEVGCDPVYIISITLQYFPPVYSF